MTEEGRHQKAFLWLLDKNKSHIKLYTKHDNSYYEFTEDKHLDLLKSPVLNSKTKTLQYILARCKVVKATELGVMSLASAMLDHKQKYWINKTADMMMALDEKKSDNH